MPYKMIDLFAGCGGLEDGFLQSGRYEDIAAVEWLQPQVKTLINRLETKWGIADAKDRVMCFDIQREDELFKGWSDASKSPSREMLPNGKAMNTADKSIGGIDYAIRRRFLFFSLLPERKTILEFRKGKCDSPDEEKKQIEINEMAVLLFDRVSELFNSENLNSEYYKDDVQIGHTYFLVTSVEQLYLRFRYQIIPILREYYKDGMFQLEAPETDTDGWYGLLGCINGTVDINADEDKIKDIFEKLIKNS